MRQCRTIALVGLVAAFLGYLRGRTQDAAVAFPPFEKGETLRYRLQWPSGLNMGEATLRVIPGAKTVQLELAVEAGLPQYILRDTYSAVATLPDLCTVQFHQQIAEGTRRWEESIDFDQSARQATITRDGQTRTIPIASCARDPLTFLYYFRRELVAGRRFSSGTAQLGKSIGVQIGPGEVEALLLAGQTKPAQKHSVTYTTPNGSKTFTLWLSTDPSRVPLRIRAPFPLAEFTAELE